MSSAAPSNGRSRYPSSHRSDPWCTMGGEVAQTDGDTYPYPVSGPGWVCFHCGERFTTPGAAGGPDREPRHPPFPPTKAHVPRPGLAAVAPPYSGLARLGSGPGCRRSASQGSDRLILRLIVGCPCSTLTPGSPGQCGALFKNYLSLSDKYCRARLSLSLSTCIIEKIALLLRSSRFVPRLVRSAGWISSFLPAAWG